MERSYPCAAMSAFGTEKLWYERTVALRPVALLPASQDVWEVVLQEFVR
jgi:hypothetical protein